MFKQSIAKIFGNWSIGALRNLLCVLATILKIAAKMATIMAAMAVGISSLRSKWGKQIVRMTAIFKGSAKTHKNFKVLQFQRKLIFRRFSACGM
jgi:uncharacterized membrane protein YczE